uniref:Uncharacterized protein n=1 Tax=Cacopsylla melanoneura TaxID=428564 RepID=A0A8D8QSQ5_9HEMI
MKNNQLMKTLQNTIHIMKQNLLKNNLKIQVTQFLHQYTITIKNHEAMTIKTLQDIIPTIKHLKSNLNIQHHQVHQCMNTIANHEVLKIQAYRMMTPSSKTTIDQFIMFFMDKEIEEYSIIIIIIITINNQIMTHQYISITELTQIQ